MGCWLESYACESLEFNNPNTDVRNQVGDDFFVLLKEWESICIEFNLVGIEGGEMNQHDIYIYW